MLYYYSRCYLLLLRLSHICQMLEILIPLHASRAAVMSASFRTPANAILSWMRKQKKRRLNNIDNHNMHLLSTTSCSRKDTHLQLISKLPVNNAYAVWLLQFGLWCD